MRALVCTGGGVGNVVMATPMIRAFADMGHELDVLSLDDRGGHELIRDWSIIRRVFTSELDADLVSAQYDVMARSVWGRFPAATLARTEISPDPLDLRRHHEAEANMTAARKAGYAGATPPPRAGFDEPDLDLPDRYTVVAPGIGGKGPAWDRKLWPHWWTLIRTLWSRDHDIVIVGSESDKRIRIGPLPDPGPGQEGAIVDARGLTSLRQAAGILAHADRVLAVDNGLAHVAAALGVETRVLFGFTSPVKNRPLGPNVNAIAADLPCRPCQMTPREATCREARCMRELTVERVLVFAGD